MCTNLRSRTTQEATVRRQKGQETKQDLTKRGGGAGGRWRSAEAGLKFFRTYSSKLGQRSKGQESQRRDHRGGRDKEGDEKKRKHREKRNEKYLGGRRK